jgi:hypothetical protein
MADRDRDFADFMDFGLGIDDVNGNIRGLAVTGSDKGQVGTGQNVKFICKKTESLEELHQGIGVSVEGSGYYGLFGGSDKFKMAQDASFKSYSVFLFVDIIVQNPSKHLIGEQLAPTPSALLSAGNFDRFRQEFGDFYIKGIKMGGEYCAIVEIETTDSSDQTNISNKLETAGFFGAGGADLATTFSSEFAKVTVDRTLSVNSVQIGGAGAGAKQAVDPGEVIAKAQNFPSQVLSDPVAYQVELQDYTALDIPAPPNAIDMQNAKDVLQKFATDRDTLVQFLNDIGFIKQHPEQFENFDNNALDALEQGIASTLNQITKAASQCLNDVRQCAFQSVTIPSQNQLPKRKAGQPPPPKFVTIPDWGVLETAEIGGVDNSGISIPSAQQLGLVLNIITVLDPSHDTGDIVKTQPPVGTSVPVGSTVTITVTQGGDI